MKLKSLCVYCGSSINSDPKLRRSVEELAEIFVSKNLKMVYGGGSVGVMGLLADAILDKGGRVTGVIPQFLMDKEVGHHGITEMIITSNMHERKQKMADLSDGFIILPGGFGTLEEFFEVLTWLQLGLHSKPIGVLNVNGFYDHLFAQMDVMVKNKFLKHANRDLVFNEAEPDILISKMNGFEGNTHDKWFKDRNLT
jgi:hypothetical protein